MKKRGQLTCNIFYIGRVEEQSFRQVRISRNKARSHGIGFRVDVIVVESGGGEVVSGQDNGSEWKRAGPHEGDPGRGLASVFG